MKNAYRIYCRVEEVVCGILFFSIVALVFSSAFLRLFSHPLIWADDIAKLFFAWVAFLGADVAMRKCRLVGVDILVTKLGQRTQKIIQIAVNLILLAILIIFVGYGFKLSIESWERFFQTIPVSYSYVTLCLPVGAICMILTVLVKLGKLFANLNDDSYTLAKASQAEEPENRERQVV